MKELLAVFLTIFVAELGDKTQLATLLYATDRKIGAWQVFLAAAAALTLSSLLAVLFGSQLGQWISPKHLKIVAGVGFIAVGIWTLWRG
ncbi:MAG TPA: TMEM165/GDT1 family protein [bacterium]|nr:TMEM165/GDT1 family protein [bacterium]